MYSIPRKRLWLILSTIILIMVILVGLLQAIPFHSKAMGTGFSMYHDVFYGYTLSYPGNWKVLSSSTHSTTFVGSGSPAPCQVDISVTRKTQIAQKALMGALPQGAYAISHTTIDGSPALAFSQYSSHVPGNNGNTASMKEVLIAQPNTARGINLYTLSLALFSAAFVRQKNVEPHTICETNFAVMTSSFSSNRTIASGAAEVVPGVLTDPGNPSIQYADVYWDYTKWDKTPGQDCPNDHMGDKTPCTEDIKVMWPGRLQPDFMCAEFVTRALSEDGFFPDINARDTLPAKLANYPGYDLQYVGNPGTSGLYEYLLKIGGTDIGDNPASAAPGDVVFYYKGSSREHAAILIATGTTVGGSDTLVDAHNAAFKAYEYTLGGKSSGFSRLTIMHLPPVTPSPAVEIYKNTGYHGAPSFQFEQAGVTTLPMFTPVSSIVVPIGWTVVAYQSPLGMSKATLYNSVPDLSKKFFDGTAIPLKDTISSLQIFHGLVCVASSAGSKAHVPKSSDSCSGPPPSSCPNTAAFIADVSYPDGTVVAPGQALNKTWRLQNTNSTCTWNGFSLNFVNGAQMGGPASVVVPTTGPGQTVDITVPLVAPNDGGTYRGNWQLKDSQGIDVSQGSGGTLWVQIAVPYASGGGGSTGGGGTDSISAFYPSVVTPGQHFQPQVTVNIASGQLLQSRGDMLRNTDGNLYGAWPFVAVTGTVNPGSAYTFTFYAGNPIIAPSVEGTYSSVWRLWQNGAWYGSSVTITFTVKNGGGTRPVAPTLLSPGNWFYARDGVTPNLCASSSGSIQYDFQIYQSAQTPDSGWISANCWTPSPSLGPYTFAWHVKVRDNATGLESDWSSTWNFSIASQQLTMDPISFSPSSPSTAETIYVRSCVHGFGDVNLSLAYDINAATDGSANGEWHGFTNAGSNCPDIHDSSTWGQFPSRNYADGDHLVRATGYGPQGQTMVVTAVYHLNHRRPQDVQLISPINGVRVNSNVVTFVWRPSIGATSYRLVVSSNGDLSSPVFDQNVGNVTSYQYTFGADLSPAYWEVYALNDVGQAVNQTSFGIDRVAPAAAVTALPATTTDSTLAVTWSGSDADAGVEWYNVQYRDGNTAGSTWVNWQTNTTAIAALFTGEPGHTYYFRAQAMDTASNLSAYAGGDGDTSTSIDLNARPRTAWWDTGYAGKRNLIVLNNDTHSLPAGYPIHLHFDAGTSPSASDIFNASLASPIGNDIRIVYQDSTELPRFLAVFNASQVDIWFDLQTALAPNPTTDTSDYQLYYGNAHAVNPPGDANSVLPPDLDTNVMGVWHTQDGSGTGLVDSSGRGHTGTLTGGSWNPSGMLGSSMVFNGSSTTANLGDSPDFDLSSFTLEGWFKFYDPGTQVLMRRSESGKAEDAYHVGTRDGKIEYQLDGRSPLRSTIQFQANIWYHIALTYDGTTMAIFVNGVEDASQTDTGGVPPGTGPLMLGNNRDSADWFKGEMQGIRVSNVARTSFSYGSFATIQLEPSTNAGSPITPPQTGTPSLAVQSVNVVSQSDGTNIFVVVVQNEGSVTTGDGFATNLYLDHQPAGPGDYTGSINSWVASPIDSNQNITMATLVAAPGGLSVSSAGIPTESTHTFYVQADATGALEKYDQSSLTIAGPISVCTAGKDAYESDDTFATAHPIATNGKGQVHNFHTAGDQDWASFAAKKGITYVINTSNLGPNADTVLSLYGPDGTTLLANNDDSNGTPASLLTWKAPADGVYYLQVTNWSQFAGGCGTSYSLAVQRSASISSTATATYNQKVSVSGKSFSAGEQVSLYLDSTASTAIVTTTASATGTIAASFAMPQAVLGTHTLYAVGQTSQMVGVTTLQIKAKLFLSRGSAKRGATISITGYGFLGYVQDITENVNVYWGNSTGMLLASSPSNSVGTTATMNITVPTVAPGIYTLSIIGQASDVILTISFKVLS